MVYNILIYFVDLFFKLLINFVYVFYHFPDFLHWILLRSCGGTSCWWTATLRARRATHSGSTSPAGETRSTWRDPRSGHQVPRREKLEKALLGSCFQKRNLLKVKDKDMKRTRTTNKRIDLYKSYLVICKDL